MQPITNNGKVLRENHISSLSNNKNNISKCSPNRRCPANRPPANRHCLSDENCSSNHRSNPNHSNGRLSNEVKNARKCVNQPDICTELDVNSVQVDVNTEPNTHSNEEPIGE